MNSLAMLASGFSKAQVLVAERAGVVDNIVHTRRVVPLAIRRPLR
jgi:hypothetical protein